jgi:hypothetical protein
MRPCSLFECLHRVFPAGFAVFWATFEQALLYDTDVSDFLVNRLKQYQGYVPKNVAEAARWSWLRRAWIQAIIQE